MTVDVNLTLAKEEALVLFEFLSRFSNREELRIDDQAEARVLWDLCCLLEKELTEPLAHDYADALKSARASVRDGSK
jgi:hypothetical protein